MRYSPRLVLIGIMLIGLAGVVYIVFLSPTSLLGSRNIDNLKNIKFGMTKLDVIKLMGSPQDKRTSHLNAPDSMYYYEPPFGASDGIYIQFAENDTVNLIVDE
ncbi:MAG: hypothetical protein V4721_00215 [Bacteroidota bacterium]